MEMIADVLAFMMDLYISRTRRLSIPYFLININRSTIDRSSPLVSSAASLPSLARYLL